MMTSLLVAAGAGCVLYTMYGVGCLVWGPRDAYSAEVFAAGADRVPLFLARKLRERGQLEDC